MNKTPCHLAIVDDDQLVVELLKNFFKEKAAIQVTITAHNGLDFIEALKNTNTIPDLVLLDLRMDKMNGIDTMAILEKEFSSIKIVVLSSHYKRSFMGFMLKSGANAFLPKGIAPDTLLEVLQEVHTKGHYFLPEQIDVIKEQLSSNTPKITLESQDLLSERELEVLKLICLQLTAKEIGERLFITQRTVEGHKNRILLKTGVKNTAGLVLYSVQHHLIQPEDYFIG
ncbi:response regulator transcription factor [uncultured Dokdonia sp.]|uniref:response regulator transcription factor n=1 Tax=uncultured Dokdonia sp. TaxID=575653 RepID=UPI002619B77D|nr:response regulator transcription factor [uncultured Dokdonia sp.]